MARKQCLKCLYGCYWRRHQWLSRRGISQSWNAGKHRNRCPDQVGHTLEYSSQCFVAARANLFTGWFYPTPPEIYANIWRFSAKVKRKFLSTDIEKRTFCWKRQKLIRLESPKGHRHLRTLKMPPFHFSRMNKFSKRPSPLINAFKLIFKDASFENGCFEFTQSKKRKFPPLRFSSR